MGDDGSESSSDDSFSYKNTAKRVFATAKKKIAAVKPSDRPPLIDDVSLESDGDSKSNSKSSATEAKDSRRKRVSHNTSRKCRRSKRVKRSSCSSDDIHPRNEVIVEELSSGSDSEKDTDRVPSAVSPVRLTSKLGNGFLMDALDILDSDGSEGDSNPKAAIALSDSSDLEVLSNPDGVASENEEEGDANELITVKISWKLQPVQKFQLRRHQKFKELMEHFSGLEGVPLQKIVIYGGKNSCRLIEPYDTPDTVGVTVTDILEGGVLVEGGEERGQRLRGLAGYHGDGITVRVQVEGVRSFPVPIGHQQKMHVLMVKVAEQMEVDVSRVRLFLDGEAINAEAIAKDLELEEGDVLDLRLL